ncbi:uncharacterized protein LOC111828585 [Capsella rubella]|nr:uncharacterized protein LOC111828585 [Capsella rubella]
MCVRKLGIWAKLKCNLEMGKKIVRYIIKRNTNCN